MNGIKKIELDETNSVLQRLASGTSVRIPRHYKYAKCRGCEAKDIIWAETLKNKKPIPIRWDEQKGWICHFQDCVSANKFRKKGNHAK
jgi:hypothetical protein